jgi:nucleoside 2-deoxyribosyltransferase
VIVVGGAYREQCVWPRLDRFRGSGIRAAIALRDVTAVTLNTATAPSEASELSAVAAAFGFSIERSDRSWPITFSYHTPVSSPAIDGNAATADALIPADADTVLRYGMLERAPAPTIKARTLVIDPQGDTSLRLDNATFEDLVIVANEREIRRLGNAPDAFIAARSFIDSGVAKAVVVKSGARGAVVVEQIHTTGIGPVPKERVNPLGSGDYFSAVLAYGLGEGKLSPVEAATAASIFTADAVSSRNEPALASLQTTSSSTYGTRPRIYVAGPFFTVGQLWLVDEVRGALTDLGGDPFSPYHDVGLGGPEVAQRDLEAVGRVEAMLALIDGFDAGTVFEIGWARRAGVPVVAYGNPLPDDELTMLLGSGVVVTDDMSTAVYRALWAGMYP